MSIHDDTRALQAGGEKLSHDLSSAGREAATLVRNLGTQAMDGAREALADATARAKGGAAELRGNARGYVRRSPWQVIGAAAAVGLVVGWLVSRG
ncbi:hypothetical protein [Ramlibacter sp.]|uniref:DUF883 family protein n=1 Tax=Ramlibacter sp. TaxID=1917967 RepID=UPI001814AE52|nr:hypothetical protein [Ramlibacter sp.]MBA2672299.1 DUF883 domain-containing protein [Ramlibacter sp.]